MSDFLKGYKTYIAAVGLLGLAVYQASQADYFGAVQSLMGALAAFGLRSAISEQNLRAKEKAQSILEQLRRARLG